MPYLLTFLMLLFTANSFASTCTSISRSNVAANSILTSTEYNGSLNTAYSAINSFDGGCVATGTLEYDSLNTTQFSAVLNGIKQGCIVSNTDTNTLSVDKCFLSINGTFVHTNSATTVTWGCGSCSAEVAATIYYLYATTGSSGATLGLLISTTAPGTDGYDASGNKVLAQFTNNFSSNIEAVLQAQNGNIFSNDWVVDVSVGGADIDLGTANVSSYTQLADGGLDLVVNDGSLLSRIPCSPANAPSGLTCSAGSEVVGVSFVLPKPSKIEVCGQFSHQTTIDNGETINAAFEWVSTSTTSGSISVDGFGRVASESAVTLATASTFSIARPLRLCSVFSEASAGQKVYRLYYEQSVTGTANSNVIRADRSASNGQRDINITVKPIY